MKIGIDIDEVMAEFVKGYMDFVERTRGEKVDFENIFSYDLWKVLKISREKAFEIAEEFADSGEFDNIQLVEGCKKGVEKISQNNKIFFITARPLNLKKKTKFFLEQNLPNTNFKLLFSGDIHPNNSLKKHDICKMHGVKILIEDNGEQAVRYASKGIKIILLDKPWNKNYVHENIFRAKDWEEIIIKINDLK